MLGAGLEVISAPQLQQSPAVLSAPAGAPPRPVDEGPTRKHRPLCAIDLNPDLSRGALSVWLTCTTNAWQFLGACLPCSSPCRGCNPELPQVVDWRALCLTGPQAMDACNS